LTDSECLDGALQLAEEAIARGDGPVAAIVVRDDVVLGLRHATLRRTDMGAYDVESCCRLTGHALDLTPACARSNAWPCTGAGARTR
jgi:tRNA(Arg) A34 adenosine deaminase TadA